MIKTAATQRLAWSLAALALAMLLTAFALEVLVLVRTAGGWWLRPHQLFGPLTATAYALAGAPVAARQPRNPIGWIFCVVGALLALTSLAYAYQIAAESGTLRLPGLEIARWLDLWVWIPANLLPLTFLLLLFPDGRLPAARWRPVGWFAGLGMAAATIGTALHPRPAIAAPPPANAFGLAGAVGVMDLLSSAALPLLLIGACGSVAALIARLRRSRGSEREQLKWLAYGGVIALICFTAGSIPALVTPDDTWSYEFSLIAVNVGLALLAVAAAIAILRYRLYDIDLLINRSLVYGALSGGVMVLYVLLVGLLGLVFQSGGDLAFAPLATALAALLAQPLRTRLQRGVNRLMYGERDDPYIVLSSLGQQLKTTRPAALMPAAVLSNITAAVGQTLKLPYVALALGQGPGLQIAAAYGRPASDTIQLPLVYQTETVGQLLVAPRGPGEAFTPAERRLLEDIALQAGVAAHAVRLSADLQSAREQLVTAREEERRRLRRDLHDGLGPQLASLTLTIGGARELLKHDPAAADRLLGELARHTQAAVSDIRRLVYALRPPALDDLGLVAALREQAQHYAQARLQIAITAPDQLPPLSAAVEVAIYRIVQEALTNVARHAQARTCTVAIALIGNALEVQIRDDGIGLAAAGRAGVGLSSMRERAAELGGTFELASQPGSGACVRARLPLGGDSATEAGAAGVQMGARAPVQEEAWSTSAS